MHVARRARETADITATLGGIARDGQHRDRSLARIAGQQRGTFRALRQAAARRVQALAHREHGTAHVRAPGEPRRRGHLTVSTDGAQLHQPRRGRDRLLNRFGDKARDFGGRSARVDRANGEHWQRHIREQRHRQSAERHRPHKHDGQDRRHGGYRTTNGEGSDGHARTGYGRGRRRLVESDTDGSRGAATRTGASCVSVRCPSTMT